MVDKSKVAILSTVINFTLYSKSSALFPVGIQKYVIDGRNRMYGIQSICYMMKRLKGRGIEWLIMADEDVIFVDPNAVYPIIEEMKSNNMTFSGVREGGEISHRTFNPHTINTFFSILNFKAIEKIWDEKEMLANQYVVENEFEADFSMLRFKYDSSSLYEPYYCFYLWMLRKSQRPLYLRSADVPGDEIANIVLGLDGKPMLYHTWFSRVYGEFEKHTIRIDKIFASLPAGTNHDKNVIIFKDHTFAVKKILFRIRRKLAKVILNKIIEK